MIVNIKLVLYAFLYKFWFYRVQKILTRAKSSSQRIENKE